MESFHNENVSHSFQSSFVRDDFEVLVNRIRFVVTYWLLFCRDDCWASVVEFFE